MCVFVCVCLCVSVSVSVSICVCVVYTIYCILQVHINSLSLCLIDDCFNRDVPLLDFTLSDAHIRHHIQGSFNGQLHARLIGEYYNRNISAWEPVIEPWM